MTGELAMIIAIALPLAGAVLIAASHRHPNQRETVTLATAGALFVLVLSIVRPVLVGARSEISLWEVMPGLSIALEVEPLGMIFALVASFLWIVTSIYAIGYMRGHHEQNQTRFFACFAISISCAIGIAFSANLFTLFIFYEALTLSTYPLVTHHGTDEARRGGRTYLGLLLFTSIGFLLLALIWTWSIAGTTDFRVGGILANQASPAILGALFVLYMFGIGKAALMPFHRWLPAAMVAPTPVSALLHAVAVVKAGVFTVVKVSVYVFGIDTLARLATVDAILYVAAFTTVTSSVIALRQDNLKRRLAYSTVSQLSYVVMAATLVSDIGMVGGAVHIAMHAFGKITLFFCAGAILVAAHKTEVSQLNGIGRAMPWTMTAFTVGALSMIGLPPTAGFISKWYILLGALDSGKLVIVGVLVLSTLLNAGYYLPIVHAAFFRPPDRPIEHGEAPATMVAAIVVAAAGTVLLFLFPGFALGLAQMVVGAH